MIKGQRIDAVVRWRLGGNSDIWGSQVLGRHLDGWHSSKKILKKKHATELWKVSKAVLNTRYIESLHKFHRWLWGWVSRTVVEATTVKLYEFVCPSFTEKVIKVDQMVAFPQGNEYLKELWKKWDNIKRNIIHNPTS